jgi:hypothetical protein
MALRKNGIIALGKRVCFRRRSGAREKVTETVADVHDGFATASVRMGMRDVLVLAFMITKEPSRALERLRRSGSLANRLDKGSGVSILGALSSSFR